MPQVTDEELLIVLNRIKIDKQYNGKALDEDVIVALNTVQRALEDRIGKRAVDLDGVYSE